MKSFNQFIAEAQSVHKFSDTILKEWERIPFVIRSTVWNRIFSDSSEVVAYHITSTSGFENLVKRQGRKNSISTFNKIHKSMFFSVMTGIETDGQVLLKLKGKQAIEFGFDAFTARTDSGYRTVMLGDRIWNNIYGDLSGENKTTFFSLRNFLGNTLKMLTVLKKPEDMDGKEKQQFIKRYLDSTENYIKKHADAIRALFMDDLQGESYNEVVMEYPQIVKAYIIDDGSFDPTRAIEIASVNRIPRALMDLSDIQRELASDPDMEMIK